MSQLPPPISHSMILPFRVISLLNAASVEEDSFFRGLLDYPHYTRPEEVRGLRVPDVLLSGHHEHIRRWRREEALRATLSKRPDLLHGAELDDEAREILERIKSS